MTETQTDWTLKEIADEIRADNFYLRENEDGATVWERQDGEDYEVTTLDVKGLLGLINLLDLENTELSEQVPPMAQGFGARDDYHAPRTITSQFSGLQHNLTKAQQAASHLIETLGEKNNHHFDDAVLSDRRDWAEKRLSEIAHALLLLGSEISFLHVLWHGRGVTNMPLLNFVETYGVPEIQRFDNSTNICTTTYFRERKLKHHYGIDLQAISGEYLEKPVPGAPEDPES